MNDLELGWVVGFLEGEGAFLGGLSNRTSGSKSWQERYLRIRVGNADIQMLERLQRLTGVGAIHEKKSYSDLTKKQIWEWRVDRKDEVLDLMQLVHPYMSARRQAKIEEIFDLYECRDRLYMGV